MIYDTLIGLKDIRFRKQPKFETELNTELLKQGLDRFNPKEKVQLYNILTAQKEELNKPVKEQDVETLRVNKNTFANLTVPIFSEKNFAAGEIPQIRAAFLEHAKDLDIKALNLIKEDKTTPLGYDRKQFLQTRKKFNNTRQLNVNDFKSARQSMAKTSTSTQNLYKLNKIVNKSDLKAYPGLLFIGRDLDNFDFRESSAGVASFGTLIEKNKDAQFTGKQLNGIMLNSDDQTISGTQALIYYKANGDMLIQNLSGSNEIEYTKKRDKNTVKLAEHDIVELSKGDKFTIKGSKGDFTFTIKKNGRIKYAFNHGSEVKEIAIENNTFQPSSIKKKMSKTSIGLWAASMLLWTMTTFNTADDFHQKISDKYGEDLTGASDKKELVDSYKPYHQNKLAHSVFQNIQDKYQRNFSGFTANDFANEDLSDDDLIQKLKSSGYYNEGRILVILATRHALFNQEINDDYLKEKAEKLGLSIESVDDILRSIQNFEEPEHVK